MESSGERPVILLNTLQYRQIDRASPTTKNHPIPNVNNAKLEEVLVKSMKSEVINREKETMIRQKVSIFGLGEGVALSISLRSKQ